MNCSPANAAAAAPLPPCMPPLPPPLPQPPLPPPLPPQPQQQHSECEAAMVFQQHQQHQHQQQHQQQHWHAFDGVPPISAMLIREADAWRALLSLHGNVVNLSRSLSQSGSSVDGAAELRFDEQREASDQREASYLASLSQLTAQCDSLVNEAIKVRGLRRAQYELEIKALKEVLRAHSDEGLALGDSIARSSGLAIASAAAEMRQAAQILRTRIQQARALLTAANELRGAGPLPADAEITMGWRRPSQNGQSEGATWSVEQVLKFTYQRGPLNDVNLSSALFEGELAKPEQAVATRTFARRAGDRELQQELAAGFT